jgi:P-type E1-E2 ATPase
VKAIVFGRLTPAQKAQICIKTKKITKLNIVAVGDGLNDTPMIQACDIGIRLVPLNKRLMMEKSER